LILQNQMNYDYYCSLLTGPLASVESVTYGINYRSSLNDISGFHVAGFQMPQDIMHILFEGVLHKEIQLMLNIFLHVEKYFILDTLNGRIENFAYGRLECTTWSISPVSYCTKS